VPRVRAPLAFRMMVCPTVANDDRKVIGMAETMSGVVVLRDAVKADAVVIPRIRAAAWRAGYPGLVEDAVLAQLDPVADTQGWLADWDTSGESRRVAEVDGTVVGYAVTSLYRSTDADQARPAGPGDGELQALHVHPSAWSLGVGSALLVDAVRQRETAGCDVVRLWVLQANTRARRLYAATGSPTTGSPTRTGPQAPPTPSPSSATAGAPLTAPSYRSERCRDRSSKPEGRHGHLGRRRPGTPCLSRTLVARG